MLSTVTSYFACPGSRLRTIEARKFVNLDAGNVIALRRVTKSSVVVGYQPKVGATFENDPNPGHRVVIVDLE